MSWAATAGAGAAGATKKKSDVEEIRKLLRFARLEGDPEAALDFLDAAVDRCNKALATGATRTEGQRDGNEVQVMMNLLACALVSRGNALLLSSNSRLAEEDFRKALDMMQQEYTTKNATNNALSDGDARVQMEGDGSGSGSAVLGGVELALCYDGLGLAIMCQEERWNEALDAFTRSLGTLGQQALSEEEVPSNILIPLSGLRGGAPTLYQRVELHYALAQYGAGMPGGSLETLQQLDKGPNPDGFPQFWEARAAQVAVLYGSGFKGKAELEWQGLCAPHPPPPPSVPQNKVKLAVNRAAQAFLDVEGLVTDNSCEDYDSGTQIPCDAAGIPGLGGSSSPCVLYTREEVKKRLWPANLVETFGAFLE